MSDGPFPFARAAMPLDDMAASIGGEGWDGLALKLGLPRRKDPYEPDAELKKNLTAFYRTAFGRELIDWIADLTLRAQPTSPWPTMEASALAYAKLEARFAVGQMLFKAIAEGNELLTRKEPS